LIVFGTFSGMGNGFESFSGQIEDDGEPNTALNIAGQAVRDFNHRSQGFMRVTRPGWRFAPDAYQTLGELTVLAGGLPQVFQQIITALRHELELNLIAIDCGTKYEGDPDAAVEAASVALERATQAAHQMYRGIADAQNAINAAAYAGPDSDEPDEEL
jgi:hypothetical protein